MIFEVLLIGRGKRPLDIKSSFYSFWPMTNGFYFVFSKGFLAVQRNCCVSNKQRGPQRLCRLDIHRLFRSAKVDVVPPLDALHLPQGSNSRVCTETHLGTTPGKSRIKSKSQKATKSLQGLQWRLPTNSKPQLLAETRTH